MKRAGTVKVVHGANEEVFEDVVGIEVGVLQRSLAHAFNLPEYADPLVNGLGVGTDYQVQPGDVVEFSTGWGWKGLGDLLTPEEIKSRWRLSEEEYQDLLDLGLPTVRFRTGSVRHPEDAVTAWWANALDLRQERGQNLYDGEQGDWCHGAGEEPPPSYPFGPLEGSQKELSSWLFSDGKLEPRRLHTKARHRAIWVRKVFGRRYEVWFKNQADHEAAHRRKVKDRPENA